MQLSDFQFELPDELIAQTPLEARTASRLLVQNGAQRSHLHFTDLPSQLREGDLLVFNDTRVIPARLFGNKLTGGKLELLVERVVDSNRILTKIKAGKAMKTGTRFEIAGTIATVLGREADLFKVEFELSDSADIASFIDKHGQVPLPPYIQRQPDADDLHRYQTVYARQPGAVAAPTAGLHFDQPLLDELKALGVQQSYITLHVGAGTFMPVRVDDIRQHTMHAERVEVSADTVDAVQRTKKNGGRVVAVGTTSVRALESASQNGAIQPYNDDTRLFVTPGYRFNAVDAMITNFHLPESTLIMLVSAFGGSSNTLNAYREAVQQRYRFFSYGDAMLVWPSTESEQERQ